MAEIEEFDPNLLTDLTVFLLKIGLQSLLFSIDFIGLRPKSSLNLLFPRDYWHFRENWPEYTRKVANF